MSKDSVEIVEFNEGVYAIRRTTYYTHIENTYQYLDADDLTYWWSAIHVKNAKTTNLDKLRKCLEGITHPDEINQGKPIDFSIKDKVKPKPKPIAKPKKPWWEKLPKFNTEK